MNLIKSFCKDIIFGKRKEEKNNFLSLHDFRLNKIHAEKKLHGEHFIKHGEQNNRFKPYTQ